MKVVSGISLNENFQASEFYLSDQKLLSLATCRTRRLILTVKPCTAAAVPVSRLMIWQISTIRNPSEPWIRVVTTALHVLKTDICMYSATIIFTIRSQKDYPSYVPLVGDNLLKQSDIYLPTNHAADQYLVVSSVSASSPDKAADQKAVMSENGEVYVSEEQHLYLRVCEQQYPRR